MASKAWLERVLGLAVMPSPPARAAVLGTPAGEPLVVLREVPGVRRVPPDRLLGLYHYAIRLPGRADFAGAPQSKMQQLARSGISACMRWRADVSLVEKDLPPQWRQLQH